MMMNCPMMAGQTQQGGMNCRVMQGQSAVGWSGTADLRCFDKFDSLPPTLLSRAGGDRTNCGMSAIGP
jgi:hypothetical protein